MDLDDREPTCTFMTHVLMHRRGLHVEELVLVSFLSSLCRLCTMLKKDVSVLMEKKFTVGEISSLYLGVWTGQNSIFLHFCRRQREGLEPLGYYDDVQVDVWLRGEMRVRYSVVSTENREFSERISIFEDQPCSRHVVGRRQRILRPTCRAVMGTI